MSRADERGAAFRERPLEAAYPYLWLDAKWVKVRGHGRVVSKALVLACAVHETGVREVIGLDVGEVESAASGSSSSARLRNAACPGCGWRSLTSTRV